MGAIFKNIRNAYDNKGENGDSAAENVLDY
jgi:hypothetical protein